MPGRVNQFDQIAARTKVIEVAPDAVAFRAHVREIIESPAFRGSRRSQEFLQFIVNMALDRHFKELKERALGVELFGRAPSYDTGDDAIVRVTACDVRKRLNHFYAEFGLESDFRVEVPPGSYIPEFRRTAAAFPSHTEAVEKPAAALEVPGSPAESPAVTAAPAVVAQRSTVWPTVWRSLGFALLVVSLCLALWFWNRQHSTVAHSSPEHILPWSAMIQPNRQIHVIFCDPEIVTIQRLLNFTESLSDYANQHYWPSPASLKPEMQRMMQAISFRGVSVAAVDAGIALRIASLTVPGTRRAMETHTARSVRLGDFKAENNFILLGSPRSNPWVDLFQDQLDFSFEFDNIRKSEFVRNKRPQTGEAATYVPTAEGWGTGQAYAIVALVSNPNQGGQVLLLAGSNAEATEAAGKLATDLDLLYRTLKSHGIDPSGPTRHFEILLRVSTMAGSPNTFDAIACRALPGKTAD